MWGTVYLCVLTGPKQSKGAVDAVTQVVASRMSPWAAPGNRRLPLTLLVRPGHSVAGAGHETADFLK